jgi:DNA transposition AAA+ family ATPase
LDDTSFSDRLVDDIDAVLVIQDGEVRRRLERQMIMSRMQALNASSTTNTTEDSVRRYYLSHGDEFSGRSFEEARDLVEHQLAALNRQGQWSAYVQALEFRAVIDWKSDDAQRAYVTGLTERTMR